MSGEQSTVVENAAPAAQPAPAEPAAESQPIAKETPASAPEAKPAPDYQRKLREFEVRKSVTERLRAAHEGPKVGDFPALDDSMDSEQWMRIRREQLAAGINYQENLEAIRQHEALERKISEETASILEQEAQREQIQRQYQEPLAPEQLEQLVRERTALNEFHADVEELRQENPEEFQRVLENAQAITLHPAVQQALVHTSFAAEVAFELAGADPEIRQEFMQLPVVEQIATLGRISGLIEAEREREAESRRPPLPRPPTPVTKAAVSTTPPREDDDADTWMAKRRAQLAKQGRPLTS